MFCTLCSFIVLRVLKKGSEGRSGTALKHTKLENRRVVLFSSLILKGCQ